MLKPHIRWMIRRDMPEVLAIEAASYAEPWGEEDFLERLRRRNVIGYVAAVDGPHGSDVVVGFFVFELHADHLVILNLAVHPDHRLQGLGRAMIGKMAGKLSDHRRTHLTADVDEANLDAHLFLKACGLRATHVISGGDPSGRDAYTFECRVSSRSLTHHVA